MKMLLKIVLLCVLALVLCLVAVFIIDIRNYKKTERAIESFFRGKQIMVWRDGRNLKGIEKDSLDFREFELIPSNEESLNHFIKVYKGMNVYLSDPGLPILVSDATNGAYTLRRRGHYSYTPRDTIAFPNGYSAIKYYLYQWKLGVKKSSFWSLEDQ